MNNHCFNLCAPVGSPHNPVIIETLTNEGSYDLIQPIKPFLCDCKHGHRTFYMLLPQCLTYGDILPVAYSEDGGTTLIDLNDRVGNYVRADRLLPYDNSKRLIKCCVFTDPLHINVISELCCTHYCEPVITPDVPIVP